MWTETEDMRTERRLAREAQTVYLGHLMHEDVTDIRQSQRVRCEVSYREYFQGEEHCGYWLITVPEVDPEVDYTKYIEADADGMSFDDFAMANHPATLATDKLNEWIEENRDYDYFSIDDTYPA